MLTEEQIQQINKECPYDIFGNCQGIFKEPNGIPNTIKEPVIYFKYSLGGVSGGSCWDDSDLESYTNDEPNFIVLDKVLTIIKPNVSYLDYKKIESITKTNIETKDDDYYGNCTDWEIRYIILSDLYKLLNLI